MHAASIFIPQQIGRSDQYLKFENYPFTSNAKTLSKTQLLEEMVLLGEMEVEEGEIRESSSSSEQSDATPCQDLVPLLTAGLIENLRAGPWKHIIYGILKIILASLDNCNIENLDEAFSSWENIGTSTIQEMQGDPSYWTNFCANLAKSIHELTVMCRPIPCDSTRHEKIVKWEAEFEKWKQLVHRDMGIQHRVIEMRVNRDRLVIELCKTTAITIERNGGLVQQIKQQQDAIDVIMDEANQVDAMKKEASGECDRLGISVMQSRYSCSKYPHFSKRALPTAIGGLRVTFFCIYNKGTDLFGITSALFSPLIVRFPSIISKAFK